jgi:hypothetical protein
LEKIGKRIFTNPTSKAEVAKGDRDVHVDDIVLVKEIVFREDSGH